MNETIIKQATESEIPTIEDILLNVVNWLNEMEQPLWGKSEVSWSALSKSYTVGNFYIAYLNGSPAGCMALVDYDPFFWRDVARGEALFVHKFAVIDSARKSGVSDAMINFFKHEGTRRGVKSLRLDTHALRPKVRAFYEHHGFVHVGTKIFKEDRHTAFYKFEFTNYIIIEQTSEYKKRIKYLPEQNLFVETEKDCLFYIKGFPHPYGWLKGYGTPPDKHLDVFLMSREGCSLGDELPIKIVGVFKRNDGDHKLVGISPERPETDFCELPETEKQDLYKLYTNHRDGEGWFGAEIAKSIIEDFKQD